MTENDNDNNIRQVIIVRKDLKMRKGKEIAQCCHASMSILLSKMQDSFYGKTLFLYPDDPLNKWINGQFTKIILYVNSEEELINIYNLAKTAKLDTIMITDIGKTEFHNIPTKTCIAIGPDYKEKIDPITKGLALL